MGRRFRFKEKSRLARPNRSNVRGVNNALGRLHQEGVGLVLLKLMDEGMILVVQETRDNDPDDRAGIDFFVTTLDGREVCIQVKSSAYYAELFREKHPNIPVVVFNLRTSPRSLERQIRSIVSAPVNNPPS